MSTKPDGGPAFPSGDPRYVGNVWGMSLRDFFAAAALAGLNACPIDQIATGKPDKHAEWAYLEADAMIAERSKL